MNQDLLDGSGPPRNKISYPKAILTIFHLLLSDILFYGMLLPLIAAVLAGGLAQKFDLTPKWELVMAVLTTLVLIYGLFSLIGETSFWKHLFAFDTFYSTLLQVRDAVNVVTLIVYLVSLSTTVETMIVKDKGMKPQYLSEGVGYVFLRKFCELARVDPAFFVKFGLSPLGEQVSEESAKFENAATYMLLWVMLTASVAKLVYFNTLFTYIRAMEIFTSMNPSFGDDEDLDDDGSELTLQSGRRSPPNGRLETDFASSIQRSQWREH